MDVPVSFAEAVTAPAGTGTTLVPTIPSHQEDDVLIFQAGWKGNQAPQTLTGWTLYFSGATGTATNGCGQGVWWRRVAPAETVTSPTLTIGTTAVERRGIVYCIRGADIDNPSNTFWQKQQSVGNSAAPTPAAVTTLAPNYLLLHLVTCRGNSAVTPPTGYNEEQDTAEGTTICVEGSTKTQTTAAAVSGQAASITSNRWVAAIIAIPSPDYPYFRSQTSTTATATSVTGTLPAGTTTADFYGRKDLILATVEAAGTAPSPNVGGDWTEIATWSTTTSGGATTVRQYWALYDGSISLQFNRSGSGEISLNLSTYRNAHQTAPIGAVSVRQNASSTTSGWDAQNRTATKSTVVAMSIADGVPTHTSPAGWTEREDGLGMTGADQIFEGTGSTASASFTLSTASPTACGLVEILSHAGTAPDITLALTSVSGTASVGTLSPEVDRALTGASATTDVGNVTPSGGVAGFPTTSILDNFNRANEGPPPSSNWTTGIDGSSGSFTVASNRAASNNGTLSTAYWNVSNFGPDVEVYATLGPTMGPLRLNFRIQQEGSSAWDGYTVLAYTPTNELYVYRVDNNTQTQLGAPFSQTIASGDSFGVSMTGSTITVYYKTAAGSWASLGTRTDSNHTAAGKLGIASFDVSGINVDDFGGGTLGADPNVTLALTGVSATGAADSLGVSSDKALTGEQATGAVDTLSPSLAKALSGNEAAEAIGTLGVGADGSLLGVEATASPGTLGASLDKALTGNESTAAIGSLSPSFAVPLNGVEGASALNSLTVSTTAPITGVEGVGAVGSLAIEGDSNVTEGLTGVQATGSPGAVTSSTDLAISGVQATGESGNLDVSVTVALTGVEAASQAGSLAAETVISGNEAATAVGSMGAAISVPLSGNQATGAVGAVTVETETGITLQLSGVLSTGQVDSLTASREVLLAGVEGITALGEFGPGISTPIGGNETVVSLGNITQSTSIALAGLVSTGQLGTLVVSVNVNLSGAQGNSAIGSVAIGVLTPGETIRVKADDRTVKVKADDRVVVVR